MTRDDEREVMDRREVIRLLEVTRGYEREEVMRERDDEREVMRER